MANRVHLSIRLQYVCHMCSRSLRKPRHMMITSIPTPLDVVRKITKRLATSRHFFYSTPAQNYPTSCNSSWHKNKANFMLLQTKLIDADGIAIRDADTLTLTVILVPEALGASLYMVGDIARTFSFGAKGFICSAHASFLSERDCLFPKNSSSRFYVPLTSDATRYHSYGTYLKARILADILLMKTCRNCPWNSSSNTQLSL